MALILVPGLSGGGVRLTASGLLFAVVAGLMYTVYLIGGKQLRRRDVHATTIVFAMSVLAAVILLPLGLAQSTRRRLHRPATSPSPPFWASSAPR